MRKFLILMLCLFLASTLVISISCKEKEEAPPAPTGEVSPLPHETIPEVPPAEAPPTEEVGTIEETPPVEEHH